MDEASLDRFVQAQRLAYPMALREIRAGKKRSHWMWYIFPQLRGLGQSAMSYRYGIADLEEAKAYLAHPLLSAHLYEITQATLTLASDDPIALFGEIDALKFRACLTLFASIVEKGSVFHLALQKYYKETAPAS